MEPHSRLTLTGLGAIALLVSGCAGTTHYRNAVHPSYGQAEFDRDNYQCQRENQHQVVFAMGGMAEVNDVVDDRMAAACFAALGWRKIEQQQITAADANNRGVAAEQQKQFGQAMQWYRKSAEQGSPVAQNNIGVMYGAGRSVTQNYAEAIGWFRKAAEQGNALGQKNLGLMYQNGWAVTQDYAEAMRLFRKAAEQGNADAQNNIGVIYSAGQGVPKDNVQSLNWFRKAAEQGNALGQKNLGLMYYNGWAVTQDYAEAMRWFRKAAEQGNADAQNNIGFIYSAGQGVPKDDVQSLKWYILAASRYPDPASRAAKNRDALTVKMTPAQIALAQGLAHEWKPNQGS